MIKILRRNRHICFPILSVLFLLTLTYGLWTSFPVGQSSAAMGTWIRGASIVPRSTTDFGSETFKQSVWNLKETGATHVGLVVPWYQTSINSTDVQRGSTTPTDESLKAAIDYAHAIGLKVMLKIHIEAGDTEWRAHINPADRQAWFRAYGDMLVHYGTLAEEKDVELVSLGTELIGMSLDSHHPENTNNWRQMIARVRAVYTGALTYGALGNGDEDQQIKFWDALDYVSTSPYYTLTTDADKSVVSLKAAWDYWNQVDVRLLHERFGKPVMFGEIGFRSLPNVHIDPWNYGRQGPADEADQARNYLAMISYWDDYPYFAGMMLWDWDSNPLVGGVGDTNFTPHGKQAAAVLKYLWAGSGKPVSVSVQSFASTREGEPLNIDAYVLNLGSSIVDANVDVEVYDAAGRLMHQQVFPSVDLDTEAMQKVGFNFIPQQTGDYRVSVGVFSTNWSELYAWGHHRGSFKAVNNPSTMRITSAVPTVLKQGDQYQLKWTDTAAGSRYNILLRAMGGKQWSIKWVATPTVGQDGTRSYNWTVGEMTDAVPIPGEYYFTVCHDYTSPCTVSSIFRLEEGEAIPETGFSIVGESSSGLGVRIKNNSNSGATALVDLELYNSSNKQTAQRFLDNQTFAPGETKEYKFDPLFLSPAEDPYHFHVGVFKPGWQAVLHWFHDVKVIEVAS